MTWPPCPLVADPWSAAIARDSTKRGSSGNRCSARSTKVSVTVGRSAPSSSVSSGEVPVALERVGLDRMANQPAESQEHDPAPRRGSLRATSTCRLRQLERERSLEPRVRRPRDSRRPRTGECSLRGLGHLAQSVERPCLYAPRSYAYVKSARVAGTSGTGRAGRVWRRLLDHVSLARADGVRPGSRHPDVDGVPPASRHPARRVAQDVAVAEVLERPLERARQRGLGDERA